MKLGTMVSEYTNMWETVCKRERNPSCAIYRCTRLVSGHLQHLFSFAKLRLKVKMQGRKRAVSKSVKINSWFLNYLETGRGRDHQFSNPSSKRRKREADESMLFCAVPAVLYRYSLRPDYTSTCAPKAHVNTTPQQKIIYVQNESR